LPGLRLRMKNLTLLDAMNTMDLGVVPTRWQRSCLPPFSSHGWWRSSTASTPTRATRPGARLMLPDGSTVQAGDPGGDLRQPQPRAATRLPRLHARAAAAAAALPQRPGADRRWRRRELRRRRAAGKTWKGIFLDEVRDRIDERRVHFLASCLTRSS